jgi:hypothetical protein
MGFSIVHLLILFVPVAIVVAVLLSQRRRR